MSKMSSMLSFFFFSIFYFILQISLHHVSKQCYCKTKRGVTREFIFGGNLDWVETLVGSVSSSNHKNRRLLSFEKEKECVEGGKGAVAGGEGEGERESLRERDWW